MCVDLSSLILSLFFSLLEIVGGVHVEPVVKDMDVWVGHADARDDGVSSPYESGPLKCGGHCSK